MRDLTENEYEALAEIGPRRPTPTLPASPRPATWSLTVAETEFGLQLWADTPWKVSRG